MLATGSIKCNLNKSLPRSQHCKFEEADRPSGLIPSLTVGLCPASAQVASMAAISSTVHCSRLQQRIPHRSDTTFQPVGAVLLYYERRSTDCSRTLDVASLSSPYSTVDVSTPSTSSNNASADFDHGFLILDRD